MKTVKKRKGSRYRPKFTEGSIYGGMLYIRGTSYYTRTELLLKLWHQYTYPFRVKLYYPVLYWLALHFPSVFRLKQADIIDPPQKESPSMHVTRSDQQTL